MLKSQFVKLLLISFLTGFLCCCHSGKNGKKDKNKRSALPMSVKGYVVTPRVLDQTILVSGTLRAYEETVLMPEVSGRVVKINLPEGKYVKEGTLLVKLFDEDLQAQLHKAQAQLDLAEQTQKRQSELMKVNGISQTDYDQTVLQVHSIRADIEVLKAQIRKTEVLAPFNGIIGLRNISVGAEVSTSTALATIRAVEQLKLDFSVPEKYSKEIKTGKKVNFTVQGDDQKYDASVIASEEGIDINTRSLKVRALVNNLSASLIPGTFANVELRLGENKNALMVPTEAIIPKERGKTIIVARNGLVHFIPVKTGTRMASTIEITEGIKPGDTIITSGILFLKENTKLSYSSITTDSI